LSLTFSKSLPSDALKPRKDLKLGLGHHLRHQIIANQREDNTEEYADKNHIFANQEQV